LLTQGSEAGDNKEVVLYDDVLEEKGAVVAECLPLPEFEPILE
jgi:hypothetical protein